MQKHLLALATGVGALALSTAAFADDNRAFITQGGAGNSGTATQIGNSNKVGAAHTNPASVIYYFQQQRDTGAGNQATILQRGNSNLVGYDAAGNFITSQSSNFGQYGSGNALSVTQAGASGGNGNNNRLGVFTQQGASNSASLTMTGSNNQVASLTQRGVGSTPSNASGSGNVAAVSLIGSGNGGASATVNKYFGSTSATHSVLEADGSTHTVSGLGTSAPGLNQVATLDQTGTGNTARLSFQGDNNNFNVSQNTLSNTLSTGSGNIFLVGANVSASTPAASVSPMVGSGNYFYGQQSGESNKVAISGASVSNARGLVEQSGGNGNNVAWAINSGSSLEVVQVGNDNTVVGSQWGQAHTMLAYQLGNSNYIDASASNAGGSVIDAYQSGTLNNLRARQTGQGSTIATTQVGMSNVAVALQGQGGGGAGYAGNTINISQR
jgi:hypothetical protein